MYLHLGNDVIVNMNSVIGIFDMDNTSTSKRTRAFLARAEKEGRVIVLEPEDCFGMKTLSKDQDAVMKMYELEKISEEEYNAAVSSAPRGASAL